MQKSNDWCESNKCSVTHDTCGRKRAEEKLQFMLYAIDNTQNQAFWVTEDGCLFYVNDAACRTLGYTREELLRMSISDIDPTNPPEVFARHWRDLRKNGSTTFESIHRSKNGHMYPVEIRANFVLFDGKEYNCAFATDISERKRAEEELRENEERFRVLAETSPAAIIVYQQEKHLYVNPHASRLTGYTQRELLEMSFWDWMHPDYKELVRERGMERQRGKAVPSQYEFKCLTKKGEEKWIFVSGGRIEYKGKPAGIVTLFDITDRKRMEEELRQAHDELEKRVEERTLALRNANELLQHEINERKRTEEDLRQANLVVEHSPAVLFRCKADPGWTVELVSRNVIQFGYSPEELLSGAITYSSLIHPQDLKRVIFEMREFTASGVEQLLQEYRIITRGGAVRWIIDQTECERNEAGEITHYQGVIFDVTDRKRAEERLQQKKLLLEELNGTLEKRVREEVTKNREKDIILIHQHRQATLGEMLDHIAHQWKQPLNSISLLLQYLRDSWTRGTLADGDIPECVGKTLALVEHMTQTMDVFRNFHRPEKERTAFNLKDSIDSALSFIAPALRFQGIEVEINAAPDLTAVGYQNEYAQVLLNILTNARDVFKERNVSKPVLKIEAFAENDRTVVAIQDNAGGIPESIFDKIFDLYFTTKATKDGTGIGLYMSKAIIEKNMGGTLSAANIDDGAQFRIELNQSGC
ncbi:MAG: PAS domain S-box protein [Desulfuromonadales bacterium]|nr:PAS domain S-box protein [Desulfuromonadales bacterium]